MLWYLHDLMEDATDFIWGSAKAAHAVLLCEMERGKVSWSDTSRIDRIWRAHAQKHTHFGKQNWAKRDFENKKPWFCKLYQLGQCRYKKDHEFGGKMQKHICSFCLTQEKIAGYPHKECTFVKRHNSKYEVGAAQHP